LILLLAQSKFIFVWWMYPWIAVWLDGVTAGMLLSAVTKIVNPIDFT
jgi:hypothetical protein